MRGNVSRGNSLEGYSDEDREASAAAGLIAGLIDGEGLEDAGIFTDDADPEEDEGTLLGDETEDEEDRMINLVNQGALERQDLVKIDPPNDGDSE